MSARYCRCEDQKPYRAPDWDIGPDGGHCRTCDLQVHPQAVKRTFAIALSERRRVFEEKPHLLKPPTDAERRRAEREGE